MSTKSRGNPAFLLHVILGQYHSGIIDLFCSAPQAHRRLAKKKTRSTELRFASSARLAFIFCSLAVGLLRSACRKHSTTPTRKKSLKTKHNKYLFIKLRLRNTFSGCFVLRVWAFPESPQQIIFASVVLLCCFGLRLALVAGILPAGNLSLINIRVFIIFGFLRLRSSPAKKRTPFFLFCVSGGVVVSVESARTKHIQAHPPSSITNAPKKAFHPSSEDIKKSCQVKLFLYPTTHFIHKIRTSVRILGQKKSVFVV